MVALYERDRLARNGGLIQEGRKTTQKDFRPDTIRSGKRPVSAVGGARAHTKKRILQKRVVAGGCQGVVWAGKCSCTRWLGKIAQG